jgi:hypothetical protein
MRAVALSAAVLAGCAHTFAGSVLEAGAAGAIVEGGVGALLAPADRRGEHALVAAGAGAIGAALIWYGVITMTGVTYRIGDDDDDAFAGKFEGVEGYLVVTDALADHAAAWRRATALGEDATVVQSDLFDQLTPHQFLVVVGRYKHRGSAAAHARAFRARAPAVQIVDGRRVHRAARRLPRFVHVRATMRWSGDPQVHVDTPDGGFDTRVDAHGGTSFWLAHAGPVTITVTPRADDTAAADPRACPIARAYQQVTHIETYAELDTSIDLTPPGCAADGVVDGTPGFLVIGGTYPAHADALRARNQLGDLHEGTVVRGDLFAGIDDPQYLVVVARYSRRDDADARARAVRSYLPGARVVDSGAVRGPLRRLVRVRADLSGNLGLQPVHVTTPDDALDIQRTAIEGEVDLWVGAPGPVTLDGTVGACALPVHATVEVPATGGPDLVLPLDGRCP